MIDESYFVNFSFSSANDLNFSFTAVKRPLALCTHNLYNIKFSYLFGCSLIEMIDPFGNTAYQSDNSSSLRCILPVLEEVLTVKLNYFFYYHDIKSYQVVDAVSSHTRSHTRKKTNKVTGKLKQSYHRKITTYSPQRSPFCPNES